MISSILRPRTAVQGIHSSRGGHGTRYEQSASISGTSSWYLVAPAQYLVAPAQYLVHMVPCTTHPASSASQYRLTAGIFHPAYLRPGTALDPNLRMAWRGGRRIILDGGWHVSTPCHAPHVSKLRTVAAPRQPQLRGTCCTLCLLVYPVLCRESSRLHYRPDKYQQPGGLQTTIRWRLRV